MMRMMPGRTAVRDASGQALPIAVAALALGALLVTPLLTGRQRLASRFTNTVGDRAHGALQHGRRDRVVRVAPTIRPPADHRHFLHGRAAPAVPGHDERQAAFPQTEIRYVPSAGGVEVQSPAMAERGWRPVLRVLAHPKPARCPRASRSMRARCGSPLLPPAASCALPPGSTPLFGASPYGGGLRAAGRGRLAAPGQHRHGDDAGRST